MIILPHFVLVVVFSLHQVTALRCHRITNLGQLRSVTTVKGVEHLVDCASNPLLEQAYGPNSPFCLQHTTEAVMAQTAADIFERIVTIGLLVVSYFYFKRTRATLMESEADDFTSDVFSSEDYFTETLDPEAKTVRSCPACNGKRTIIVDDNESLCNICGGTGTYAPASKRKTYGLPSSNADEES